MRVRLRQAHQAARSTCRAGRVACTSGAVSGCLKLEKQVVGSGCAGWQTHTAKGKPSFQRTLSKQMCANCTSCRGQVLAGALEKGFNNGESIGTGTLGLAAAPEAISIAGKTAAGTVLHLVAWPPPARGCNQCLPQFNGKALRRESASEVSGESTAAARAL